MHEAFFFGPDTSQLFGVYHPPRSGVGRVLTLISPPILNDYSRTHAAFRRLALALADAGQHVLRFDYRGTGDSAGALKDVSVPDWTSDIQRALQEGRDISGCRAARLLTARGGALLACAASITDGLERIVLWDPALSGAEYLGRLSYLQQRGTARNIHLSRAERGEAARDHGTYRLGDNLSCGLASLSLDSWSGLADDMLQIVTTTPSHNASPLLRHTQVVEHHCDWDDLSEDLILPDPVLERLTECLTHP